MPDFLDLALTPHNLNENATGGGGENVTTGFGDLWVLANPIMLHEWDEVKYKFSITAGGTDPAANEDPSSSDVAIICFLDGTWARASDGTIKYGIYQQDENEANVGATEGTSQPMTSGACVQIEGI